MVYISMQKQMILLCLILIILPHVEMTPVGTKMQRENKYLTKSQLLPFLKPLKQFLSLKFMV